MGLKNYAEASVTQKHSPRRRHTNLSIEGAADRLSVWVVPLRRDHARPNWSERVKSLAKKPLPWVGERAGWLVATVWEERARVCVCEFKVCVWGGGTSGPKNPSTHTHTFRSSEVHLLKWKRKKNDVNHYFPF